MDKTRGTRDFGGKITGSFCAVLLFYTILTNEYEKRLFCKGLFTEDLPEDEGNRTTYLLQCSYQKEEGKQVKEQVMREKKTGKWMFAALMGIWILTGTVSVPAESRSTIQLYVEDTEQGKEDNTGKEEEDKKDSQDQGNQTMAGSGQQQNDAESAGQEKQAEAVTAVPTGDLSLEIRIGEWLLVSGTAIVGVLFLDHIRERKEEELDGMDTGK